MEALFIKEKWIHFPDCFDLLFILKNHRNSLMNGVEKVEVPIKGTKFHHSQALMVERVVFTKEYYFSHSDGYCTFIECAICNNLSFSTMAVP